MKPNAKLSFVIERLTKGYLFENLILLPTFKTEVSMSSLLQVLHSNNYPWSSCIYHLSLY